MSQAATDYTLYELLAVTIARDIQDPEVGFTGLVTGGAAAIFGSSLPIAAMTLASRMQAPNLTILLAGWLHNPNTAQFREMPASEFDPWLLDVDSEAWTYEVPGQWLVKRGDIDFGFSSAAQVDQFGNMNSVCIGDYARPRVRLVGPIFQPEHLAFFGREYIMMPHHERRNFVEKVDFVSAVGYPGGLAGRRALGLKWGGPRWVVTPRCVFDFDLDTGRMRVKWIHPGATAEEVQASTDFDLGDLSGTPITPPPTDEELRLLREEIDPRAVLLPRLAAA